jgi:hypothetical protein
MDWKRIQVVACTCALGLGLYSETASAAHQPGCSRYQKDAAICSPVFEAEMQPHSIIRVPAEPPPPPIDILFQRPLVGTVQDVAAYLPSKLVITTGTGILRIN